MPEQPKPIPALTGIRLLAALSVVCAHAISPMLTRTTLGHWVVTAAVFGMTLFFVLSGFVIHYNYRNMVATGTRGYGVFLWARLSRLYPLFLLFLIGDFVLNPSPYQAIATGSFRDWLFQIESWLPYHLTFTQTWVYLWKNGNPLVYQDSPTVQVMWSISTEFFFYLFYPIVLILISRLTRARTTLIAMLAWSLGWFCLVAVIVAHQSAIDTWSIDIFGPRAGSSYHLGSESFIRWLVYFSPYLRIGEFVLGCLTAQLFFLVRDRRKRWESVGGTCLTWIAVLATVIVNYLAFTFSSAPGWALNFDFAPSIALLIFCVARYETSVSCFFSAKAIVVLGGASYSIYLSHMAILSLFEEAPPAELGNAAAIAVSWVRFGVCLCVVLLVSLQLERLIEAPSRRWLRRLYTQRVVGQVVQIAEPRQA